MSRQLCSAQRARVVRSLFVAIASTIAVQAVLATARAADLAEQVQSLRKVPADVSFYSASLRLAEQWKLFRESKAYDRLMQIPAISMGKIYLTSLWEQSDEPHVVRVREYLQSQPGKDVIHVLKEMFSDEAFVYGGSDIATSMKIFMELDSLRKSQFPIKVEGTTGEEDSEKKDETREDKPKELNVDRVLEILEKHSGSVKVPTMVMGFRIKDEARAARQLDEVHSLIRNVLDEKLPELAAHIQSEKIGGHEFLTLRLDGSMIPWEKIRDEAEELDDKQIEKLREAMNKHKLAIALGVVGKFVLVSVGESTDQLEKIGEGPVLAENPAIKRLKKHAGERVVAIQYMSKALAQSMGSTNQTIENMANQVDDLLERSKVKEEQRKQIAADIRSLDLGRYMPQPSEQASIAYLTGRGYEAFQYTQSKMPLVDSSKPLTILNHVGGTPVLLVASRSKDKVEDYERCIQWLKQTAKHVEAIAKDKADSDNWDKYQEIRGRAIELLKRLDEANREHLYPALADGQAAIVLDISATSKQWFKKMPASPKPLPMVELAFAASVSDAEKFRQGVREYIDVAKDAYELVKESNPDDFPKFKLPKGDVSELSDGGKLYSYPCPKKWGVDSQVAVNAGLTDELVAISTMPKTTERLLRDTKPDLDTTFKLDRPAGLVTHIEIAKMIDAVRPWIDYGVDVATGKLKPKSDENKDDEESDKDEGVAQAAMMAGLVVPQVHQFLEVATAVRSASSISYDEDGLWVTHSELHIEDLK